MRSIRVTEFGGPAVLVPVDAPDPVPGPGETVVSVAVCDVLFLDTVIRSGRAAQWFPVAPPYIPGGAVGGRVAETGDGVPASWLGQPVIGLTGAGAGGGGYASAAVVPVDRLVEVPDGVDLQEATALSHDGATALALAERTGIGPGQRVLVMGAAGGLGALLIQLARSAGAWVIGAARGEAKLALIRELGADAAVDYSEPGWTKRVTEASGGAGPDVVFDGVGGDLGREAFGITATGGRFSAHGAPAGGFAAISHEEAASRGVTVRGIEQAQFQSAERAEFVRRALAELAAGRIKPVIGQRFPLDQAAVAHSGIEARTSIGKTLLVT